MIISFSGNDGSGKTTIGKSLIGVLNNRGMNVIYKHEYDYVFLKYFFKIVGEKTLNRERQKYVPKQSEKIENVRAKKLSMIQRLWPYAVWSDNLMTILMYKLFYQKKVLLLDRYPYDMYMSFEYMGRGSKFLKKLFYSIPKADVQIIFFASPEIAMQRKTDHTYPLSFYVMQLERYKKLATEKNIEMHNTEEPLEETIKFILTRIKNGSPQWLKHEL